MKLNNRGWGLSVFLGFTVVILICILVAGANAYKLGLTKDTHERYFESEIPMNTPNSTETPVPTESPVPTPTPTPTETPEPTPIVIKPAATAVPSSISSKINLADLRQDAIQAACIYKNLNRKSMTEGEEFTISFQKLIDYGYMKSFVGCTGYVTVHVAGRKIRYIPYLNCPNYVSDGYRVEFDEK